MATSGTAPLTSLLPPGLVLRFDNTLGVALLAAVLNALLYGILCLQTYNFYQRFDKETRLLKYSVAFLWVLDTLHLIFIVYYVYETMVTNFGDLAQLAGIPWSILASYLATSLTILLVQGWFCYRVWIMSEKNKLLTYPLLAVVAAAVAFSLANNIKLFFLKSFADFRPQQGLYYGELISFALGDFYIAISLCCLLYSKRKAFDRTYMQHTYSMLNTLIIYTIETGLLTSFFALASLICCAAMPDNFIFIGIYLLLSGLYSNSLMASLNAREKFRQESSTIRSIPLNNLNTIQTNHEIAFAASDDTERGVQVAIRQDMEYKRDDTKGTF